MLCAVRCEWLSGTRIVFNCYRYWATLVINKAVRAGKFLHSKKGMTQGGGLVMIAYGIIILPLIMEL